MFLSRQYEDGEEVVLWMNTVGPYHNRQETYTYFSLPFCKGSKKDIGHYHETLGEAIQGVELDFSGIDIAFKGLYSVLAAILVTFVGTVVAVPPPSVGENDCQHQDLFDSTLRGGESRSHM